MLLSSIPELSLVLPSDMDEASRATATPDIGQDLAGVVNFTEPLGPLPFPPVPPDPDTAFRFQSDFVGLSEDLSSDIVMHWASAVQRGGGTPQWQAFVARWQATMPGLHKRYALFHLLILHFGRLDPRLRLPALACFLADGPQGRAAVQRNWKRIGLGKFARGQWPTVQRMLREAGLLR
ncbi:hypothetical protein PCA31118_01181 [Pandoraea captiosa]|uniref:Uncharacterized protein n=1 Tax=Pandoraea captiosa TaxID=2508302 RepID=A0A5E4ZPV2_9BURK|nr:hypothetical protein [Pandoraea captiosa]VVE63254.1 hypothetical protein PCA31118_01181 [Pandoraea captiosa]